MSSSPSPDPRLLLPEWLRDGDGPIPVSAVPASETVDASVREVADVAPAAAVAVVAPATQVGTPYSDRLSVDSRLDPANLVSESDLPTWLGGLARVTPATAQAQSPAQPVVVAQVSPIEEAAPYEGVDAPEPEMIEVQLNGWYLVAGALGLLILLAAAFRVFLS